MPGPPPSSPEYRVPLSSSHAQSCSCPTCKAPWGCEPWAGEGQGAAEQNTCSCFWQTPARVTAGKRDAKSNWTDPRGVFLPPKHPAATHPFHGERAKMVPSTRSLCPLPGCRLAPHQLRLLAESKGKAKSLQGSGTPEPPAHARPGLGVSARPIYPLTLKKPMMPTPYSTQYLSSSSRFQASRLTYLRMFS